MYVNVRKVKTRYVELILVLILARVDHTISKTLVLKKIIKNLFIVI